MPDYETWAAKRDVVVDEWLGDNVQISLDGGGFDAVKAFVLFEHAGAGIDGIDTIAQRTYLKIAKRLLPDPDGHVVRVRATKLEGTWEPAGSFDDDGTYWIFDLQRVSG